MSFAKRLILPPVINHVLSSGTPQESAKTFVVATGNKKKLEEFERILKGYTVIGRKLDLPEIQSEDPIKVLEEKAREAWKANNGVPIMVEDSSLSIAAFDNLPGPFAEQLTNTIGKRTMLCQMLTGKDRSAFFQVGIAVFDGIEVHSWIGKQTGKIAERATGAGDFGFNDIFIPDGQKGNAQRTYAEMTGEEKDTLSPRKIALDLFMKSPPDLGMPIFSLPDPMHMQSDAVDPELLRDPKVRTFAYAVEPLSETKPVAGAVRGKRKPYREYATAGGELKQIVLEDSPSIGLLRTPMDTWVGVEGRSRRLLADEFGNIRLWQMSDAEIDMALAGRAYEFTLHHNPEMYDMLRKMLKGTMKTAQRPNKRSLAIEKMLDITRKETESLNEEMDILGTAATREIGYSRISSGGKMSRTQSANTGLILTTGGFPSSLFSLGGMPPVTGWRDVLITSAMSYMRSYIPRNSIFAGNLTRQIALFTAVRETIQSFNLPKDIEALVMKQVGISVGCEDAKGIVRDLKKLHALGLSSVRIYTTNPDTRIIETAEAIKQAFGDDMTLCVGPIVDKKQADLLIGRNIQTNILLAGHGGGENCTSLEGGGTANALEILYLMYLDSAFNETAIGLEGGTGNSFGALLGMLDVISLNRRGVKGGIETGGVYFEHTDGSIVQPYSGSASAITQWIEAVQAKDIAHKRLNPSGSLRNVEGKPNYMRKGRSIHSITDNFREQRMLAGRALADQEAHSISELRENISKVGSIINHRYVSSTAAEIASAHRTQV